MVTAEPQIAVRERNENCNVSLLLWGALIVGVLSAILFHAFPQIDLATSGYFYTDHVGFIAKGGGILAGNPPRTLSGFVRLAFYAFFIIVCLLTLAGLFAAIVLKRDIFGLGWPKWLFLAICLIVGPGLLGNVVFKDHWGRARPIHVTEFGGTKSYTEPLVPADQCTRNCSFIAGEASMVYAAFFAAAFLFPCAGRKLIAAGTVLGSLSGIVRVSQGAHFLSDVVFAGVAMALTVVIVYLIFRRIFRTGVSRGDSGPPLTGRSFW